jgi:hypothetical protein
MFIWLLPGLSRPQPSNTLPLETPITLGMLVILKIAGITRITGVAKEPGGLGLAGAGAV